MTGHECFLFVGSCCGSWNEIIRSGISGFSRIAGIKSDRDGDLAGTFVCVCVCEKEREQKNGREREEIFVNRKQRRAS